MHKIFFSIPILVTISKDPFHAFSTNDDIFRDVHKKHKSSISEDPFHDLMTKTKHTSSIHPYNRQQEYPGYRKIKQEQDYQPYEPKGNTYHSYPISQEDTNLPISFSNSLLDPSQFMRRTTVESKVPASMQQMFSSVPSNDETSKATFSSVSNLLHNSPAKPIPKTDSIYSYFESKRLFDKHNWGEIESRGDQNPRPINTKKQTVSSIPNRWSDLVIGRWPNTAKHFLNLEKRKKHNSELSSFRKRGTLGVNEFSTKKLPWLLGRAKRDLREKMSSGI